MPRQAFLPDGEITKCQNSSSTWRPKSHAQQWLSLTTNRENAEKGPPFCHIFLPYLYILHMSLHVPMPITVAFPTHATVSTVSLSLRIGVGSRPDEGQSSSSCESADSTHENSREPITLMICNTQMLDSNHPCCLSPPFAVCQQAYAAEWRLRHFLPRWLYAKGHAG
jgi:hypothetical protein